MPIDDRKPLTRARAIRYKCLDCCCGSVVEVRECPIKDCSLWPFRLGKVPRDQQSLNGNWRRGL